MSEFQGNAVTWFEIPTRDFTRATNFYEQLLEKKLIPYGDGISYALFPSTENEVVGALVQRPGHDSCNNGSLIYLNVDGQLDATLERAQKLNAKIVTPRMQVPGGKSFFAHFEDSEGNRIGLHSRT